MVGIANTGTGKTAAFLVPAINKSLLNKNNKTIIIVPTRELAFQIEKEFRDFAAGLHLFSVLCIGGTSISDQLRNVKRNNDFVINGEDQRFSREEGIAHVFVPDNRLG